MGYDLVIFDCDGVLIDSEIISARMLVEELAKLGVSIDLAYVARHFLGRSYPVVMSQVRRDFGLDLTPEFEAQYRETLLAAFERDLKVMPHVIDVIDALGIPYCIATSSSPRRARMSLEIAGLGSRASDRLFTSSMVANGKPAPDLLYHAARALGTDPSRCLVIEDSLNGIRAGLAAGMAVWRFVGGSHLGPDEPTEPEDAVPLLRFASFADFYKIGPELKKDAP